MAFVGGPKSFHVSSFILHFPSSAALNGAKLCLLCVMFVKITSSPLVLFVLFLYKFTSLVQTQLRPAGPLMATQVV